MSKTTTAVDWRKPKILPCYRCGKKTGLVNINGMAECHAGHGCRTLGHDTALAAGDDD